MTVPAQFYCRLQKGIAGGFAPPTPSEIHVLSRGLDNPTTLLIQSEIRKPGTPNLVSQFGGQGKSVTLNETKIAELYGILKKLPTEQPPGSEDIYGLDTMIMWGSDDLEWANGGPQGCGGGTSDIQPTDAQKAEFKKAVEIIKSLT